MTQLMDCTVYYSTIGEHFNIYERNTDPNLIKAKALVHVHSGKYELVLAGNHQEEEEEPQYEHMTRLLIPHEVIGGPFFANDTQCIIVNGKNQILKLDGKYRFGIKMYRNLNDPNLFSIIFKEKEFTAQPEWVSF